LAYKEQFFQLPVVNMWAALTAFVLRACHVQCVLAQAYDLHISHDVDLFEHDNSLLWLAQTDRLMGQTSSFYFMGPPTHPQDGDFVGEKPDLWLPLAKKIRDEFGHRLGFHPGMDSWLSPAVWKAQYEAASRALGTSLKEGRQHYLRYALPFTWRLWDENAMELDTGLGHTEGMGFRCGTGNVFRVFDILTRTTLNLKERGLAMQDAFSHITKKTLGNMFAEIDDIAKNARRYGTPLSLLFHNNFFHARHQDKKDREYLYMQCLKKYA
jgi:hypothetical protein